MNRDLDSELKQVKEQEAELVKQISDAQAKLNWQKEHKRLHKIYFPEAQVKPKSKTHPLVHAVGLSVNVWLLIAIVFVHYLN